MKTRITLVRSFALLLLASFCVTGCASLSGRRYPSPDPDQILPVVAVSSFQNRSGFSGSWQIGSGMADILVSELMDSRNFVVVERAELKTVVNELNLQQNPGFRKEGKVKTGNLKNAHYIIRGVINDFSQVGGSSFSMAIKRIFFGGKTHRARVSLTLTIVDVETGEILESVQCKGIARAREAFAKGAYKNVAFGGDTFFKTPLGEATAYAISSGVNQLIKSIPEERWSPMIAELEVNGIVINGGANRGLKPGMLFDVFAHGRAITDPATGNLLSIIPGPVIGRIKITTVNEKISFAEIDKGSGFQRGMPLKSTN